MADVSTNNESNVEHPAEGQKPDAAPATGYPKTVDYKITNKGPQRKVFALGVQFGNSVTIEPGKHGVITVAATDAEDEKAKRQVVERVLEHSGAKKVSDTEELWETS